MVVGLWFQCGLTSILLIIHILMDGCRVSYARGGFGLETSFGIAHISALRLGEDRRVACTKNLAMAAIKMGRTLSFTRLSLYLDLLADAKRAQNTQGVVFG